MAKSSNKEIAEAIYKATKDQHGAELKKTLEQVVMFLSRRRLISQAPLILNWLNKIINEKEKRIIAKVTSAHKLSDRMKIDLKHDLTHRYKKDEVILEENINESLLGGMRIEVDDEVIDLTLRNKISQLQEHLMRTN